MDARRCAGMLRWNGTPMLRTAFAWTIVLFVFPASSRAADVAASTPTPSVVDRDRQDLIRSLPELAALQSDDTPARLQETIHAAGEALSHMLDGFVDVSAAEEIHEMRLGAGSAPEEERREHYRY
ncbi:MAG TPA: hypothetical protein VFB20_09105, partial [Burkholderiales bacterium]|nr:hypothetical protein [Burkholderiales bacterium]